MAELTLTQITQKLNELFEKDSSYRTLVFWYDANADFKEEIASLDLHQTKIWMLEENHQLEAKYHLEIVDPNANYLVYAPFEKPSLRENHLADMLYYATEFHADRASLLALRLGISGEQRTTLQQYLKFFANKERTNRFVQLGGDWHSQESIEVGLMSVLCKVKAVNFEEVVRTVLVGDTTAILEEFQKYQLLDPFWTYVDEYFGIQGSGVEVDGILQSLFVTSLSRIMQQPIPTQWQSFLSPKSGTCLVFLERLMYSQVDGEWFDTTAATIFQQLGGKPVFDTIPLEQLMMVPLFAEVDERIIEWMVGRLVQGDFEAEINHQKLLELIATRSAGHFGKHYHHHYAVIQSAHQLLTTGAYRKRGQSIQELVKRYEQELYKIDQAYRQFCTHYDVIEDVRVFEELSDLVEMTYTNEFLHPLILHWTEAFKKNKGITGLPLQRNFYNDFLLQTKERTVVIISDALRYEVAHELFEQLQADEKCEPTLQAMQGILPSYTKLGMAALLPHQELELTEEYDVLVDQKPRRTVEARQEQLRVYKPNSLAVKYDDIKEMKQSELRTLFKGQDVIYLYHDQIDARGDKPASENEVFTACKEAIQEIHHLIRRIASHANTTHFIVTSDHGFIYRRKKIQSYDKIHIEEKKGEISRRHIVSTTSYDEIPGVHSMSLGTLLGNGDYRLISFAHGADIFEKQGAGINYVHGGPSPQEMVIPLLKVRVEKSKRETRFAAMTLVSVARRITSQTIKLEFLQREPVTDIVKAANYQAVFVDKDGVAVSNEALLMANSVEVDSTKRITEVAFLFKNQRFDKGETYYLVGKNLSEKSNVDEGIEAFRYEYTLDIPYADDNGYLE